MMTNKFGEIVLDENDLQDLMMQGYHVWNVPYLTVQPDVLDTIDRQQHLSESTSIHTWHVPASAECTIEEFDRQNQSRWFMPESYRHMDIAQHIVLLANNEAELQRCAQELLLFQERGLFDLLRYLKYLVDTMKQHGVIWGLGRGSSVASFVLYKLGVHRIDSLYYDLDPREFLR